MKRVLIILSTSRTSEEAISFAVARAKEKGLGILALYIIDTKLTNELFDKFTDIGFIGDKPSTQLMESIMKEYRQRGYEEIGTVQKLAMEQNIDFDGITTQGDFVDEAIKVIRNNDVESAVAVKRKILPFLKYFSKSVVDELVEVATCEVTVFEQVED